MVGLFSAKEVNAADDIPYTPLIITQLGNNYGLIVQLDHYSHTSCRHQLMLFLLGHITMKVKILATMRHLKVQR